MNVFVDVGRRTEAGSRVPVRKVEEGWMESCERGRVGHERERLEVSPSIVGEQFERSHAWIVARAFMPDRQPPYEKHTLRRFR